MKLAAMELFVNEIEFEVLDIVTKVVGLEAGSVTTSTSIRDLGVTSMKIVEMILMIEKNTTSKCPMTQLTRSKPPGS